MPRHEGTFLPRPTPVVGLRTDTAIAAHNARSGRVSQSAGPPLAYVRCGGGRHWRRSSGLLELGGGFFTRQVLARRGHVVDPRANSSSESGSPTSRLPLLPPVPVGEPASLSKTCRRSVLRRRDTGVSNTRTVSCAARRERPDGRGHRLRRSSRPTRTRRARGRSRRRRRWWSPCGRRESGTGGRAAAGPPTSGRPCRPGTPTWRFARCHGTAAWCWYAQAPSTS